MKSMEDDLNIDDNVESITSLSADDTRVMRAVKNEEDVEQLQADLDKLYNWQENNNMLFNGNKFEVLRYGNNTELKDSTSYFTPNYLDVIEEKDNLRDLGIMITNDGKFSNHVEHVCSKVKHKSGWITGTLQCRKNGL